MPRLIHIDAIAPQPWKNGGGVTREIARADGDGDFLWRLSVAEVARDGPFSAFPGKRRVLTVLDGAGMRLRSADGVIDARPGAPVSFDGETPIVGELIEGPVRDFNLIFDPARAPMNIARIEAGEHCRRGIGLLPLAGRAVIDGAVEVPTGAYWAFDDDELHRIEVAGAALLVAQGFQVATSLSTALR